ncbi:cyclic nucleotide-regulated ABC bacteriocin/lantibiotic exporter [Nostoc carneum NIES-2107]|nr:cyclic nucleotide-regulated ABC bacteriocin/lantibiotic exporter [Nostoc carneum NIES-2107]
MFFTQVNYSVEPYSMKVNQRVILNHPETLWIVESGKLALYATRIRNGSPEGHRRFLFHVSTGEALFGTALLPEAIAPGQWAFVAVAIEPTQLSQQPITDLLKRVANGEMRAIALIEDWIYNIDRTFNNPQPIVTPPFKPVLADLGNFSLYNGEALQVWQKTVFWVKLHQGNLRWLGIDELSLNANSSVFPLTTAMYLESGDTTTGIILPTAELAPTQLLAGLASLHSYFFDYLSLRLHQETEAEFRKFQKTEQVNRQAIKGALGELATVLQPQEEFGFFQQSSALLMAMGAIGRVLKLTIRPPIAEESREKDPVIAIAQASQIRVRRVRLAAGWWRKEHGPLLASTVIEKQPVALLPVKSKGYVLFDPQSQTRTPVNETVAQTLAAEAYVLYQPLPPVVNNALDLLKFATNTSEKDILSIVLLGVVATVLGMIAPQATAILINHAIPESDRILLWQIGLVLLAVAIAQLVFQIAQSIVNLRLESLTENNLQPAIWDRLLRLSPTFFRQYTAGDLVNRVLAVRRIHQKFTGVTQRTLFSGVFALLNLVLMFVYSWQLACVGVGLALVAGVITSVSSLFLVKKSRQQQQLDGAINGLTVQLINGVAKLRVAMAEERAFAAWAKKYSQRIRLKASSQQISDFVAVFNEALPLISSILLFGLGTSMMQTQLSLGTFIAFSYALGIFIKGVTDLSNTITEIWAIIPLWERAQPILQAPVEADAHKIHPGKLTGRVALENLSFRYSENGPLILNDVSLYANPGEFIAIVGLSGSGKSTIFRLLLGFETPLSGGVYYDGKDLANLDLQSLRRSLGVVLQNGKIGTGSIFENITAGALVTIDEAWEAARMAGLADDIEQMPMGMHTIISEGGTNLSGGQRQRLLIARSLVGKPKVVLMDEATSALDNRTQAIVSNSLNQLQATRIVIAHRLSTIRNADRIYVIDAGRVVQAGTFSQLITQEGLFSRLIARQLEGGNF